MDCCVSSGAISRKATAMSRPLPCGAARGPGWRDLRVARKPPAGASQTSRPPAGGLIGRSDHDPGSAYQSSCCGLLGPGVAHAEWGFDATWERLRRQSAQCARQPTNARLTLRPRPRCPLVSTSSLDEHQPGSSFLADSACYVHYTGLTKSAWAGAHRCATSSVSATTPPGPPSRPAPHITTTTTAIRRLAVRRDRLRRETVQRALERERHSCAMTAMTRTRSRHPDCRAFPARRTTRGAGTSAPR